MQKTAMGLMLSLVASTALAQGDGPFCVHTTGLQQCLYYSVDDCQAAARLVNGLCAPNPIVKAAPDAPLKVGPMEAMEHVLQGGEAGRQRGMQQRAIRERAERLRSQDATQGVAEWEAVAEAVEAEETKGKAQFRCNSSDGAPLITTTPQPGCVYLGVGE